MINFMLKIAEKKNKATKNVVMQYVFKCVQCIFACLQRLVQFINKFTYVSIGKFTYTPIPPTYPLPILNIIYSNAW